MTDAPKPGKCERDIQHAILLAINARYHPDGLAWTTDTGVFHPQHVIKAILDALLRRYGFGGSLRVQDVLAAFRGLPLLRVGIVGQGDIHAVVRGVPFYLEVKTTKGRQRKAQANFERAITRAGGVYAVVRSAEEAMAVVEERVATRSITKP